MINGDVGVGVGVGVGVDVGVDMIPDPGSTTRLTQCALHHRSPVRDP